MSNEYQPGEEDYESNMNWTFVPADYESFMKAYEDAEKRLHINFRGHPANYAEQIYAAMNLEWKPAKFEQLTERLKKEGFLGPNVIKEEDQVKKVFKRSNRA